MRTTIANLTRADLENIINNSIIHALKEYKIQSVKDEELPAPAAANYIGRCVRTLQRYCILYNIPYIPGRPNVYRRKDLDILKKELLNSSQMKV
jgi:hypothetical protein